MTVDYCRLAMTNIGDHPTTCEVLCGYDNSLDPNEPTKIIMERYTPNALYCQLQKQIEGIFTTDNTEGHYIFLNSWNHWEHQQCTEPDQKGSAEFLNMVNNLILHYQYPHQFNKPSTVIL